MGRLPSIEIIQLNLGQYISYQARGGTIPKQYSKPMVRDNNQNVGQQCTNQTGNSNFNSNSNFNLNFKQRQTQNQNFNSNFNQRQTQNQNYNPNFNQRQTQKSNIILCRRCGRTGHKSNICQATNHLMVKHFLLFLQMSIILTPL